MSKIRFISIMSVFLISIFCYTITEAARSIAVTAISVPTITESVSLSESQIKITWTDSNKKKSGFEVERSLNQTSGFTKIKTVSKRTKIYTDAGLNADTTYYYRVRTYNSSRKTGTTYSPYSSPASATTQGSGPVCGNGVPESGEACDDGAANGTTACGCQSGCTYASAGTSCNDGQYCNGTEICNGAGSCLAGIPVNCSDGVSCTYDSCNEASNTCVNTANNANCPNDGLFCNGSEFCDPVNDCSSTGDPCSGGEVCNESSNICEYSQNELDDPPSDLIATTVSSSQINLDWIDNADIENEFHVSRYYDSSIGWEEIGIVGASPGVDILFITLIPV